ncbi:MAG: acetate--CoA ligase family protein [Dehalococcoidia bacterium]
MSGEIITRARKENRSVLNEIESKQIISEAGIPVIESVLATTKAEAVKISRQTGFPVALKVISPDVVHKSDSGGVMLNLQNTTQVGKAYSAIMKSVNSSSPGARIEGVSVQKMARPGVEVIMGISRDPQFGPVLMFGLGGVFVEVLEDVSFRIVPLQQRDARQMIREIKGFPLLNGYRGQEPVDISFLESILLRLSGFVEKTPHLSELDLNPVFAYSDGAVVADARIVLGPGD